MPKTTPPANELALQRMVAQPANRAKALAQQQSGAIAGSVPTGTESTGFATPASATSRVAADYGILQPYGSGTGTGQWMTSGVGYETLDNSGNPMMRSGNLLVTKAGATYFQDGGWVLLDADGNVVAGYTESLGVFGFGGGGGGGGGSYGSIYSEFGVSLGLPSGGPNEYSINMSPAIAAPFTPAIGSAGDYTCVGSLVCPLFGGSTSPLLQFPIQIIAAGIDSAVTSITTEECVFVVVTNDGANCLGYSGVTMTWESYTSTYPGVWLGTIDVSSFSGATPYPPIFGSDLSFSGEQLISAGQLLYSLEIDFLIRAAS